MREVVLQVKLTDDLDPGVEAVETHYLGLNGRWVELDLSGDHSRELEKALERFLNAGRKVPAEQVSTKPRTHGERAASIELNKQIRDWAKAQDPPLPVSSAKGYIIPLATRRAYEDAITERTVS